MDGVSSLEQERAKLAENALDDTLKAAEKRAAEYLALAHSQRVKYSVAKSLAVVLGVLTPTFVAFQTQHSSANYSLLLGIIAISLTAGTGIVTGLQATFKWGEGFGRSTTAALQLQELVGLIGVESLLYRTTPDYGLKYNEMKRLYEKAWQQMQRVIQTQSQSEIADITQPTKHQEELSTATTPAITKA
jgi:hypothetical protein